MTVTTSKGKTFDVDWMWGPVGYSEDLMLQYTDGRPIWEIASDFAGCDHFHRESDTEGDMDFDGYTLLKAVIRPDMERNPDIVQITLTRPRKVEDKK